MCTLLFLKDAMCHWIIIIIKQLLSLFKIDRNISKVLASEDRFEQSLDDPCCFESIYIIILFRVQTCYHLVIVRGVFFRVFTVWLHASCRRRRPMIYTVVTLIIIIVACVRNITAALFLTSKSCKITSADLHNDLIAGNCTHNQAGSCWWSLTLRYEIKGI